MISLVVPTQKRPDLKSQSNQWVEYIQNLKV